MDCIFCKIINKEAPADFIYEDDEIIVIKDIKPSASVHLLIIPKKHIDSLKELSSNDKDLMGQLILIAQKVAQEKNLKDYRLRINVGKGAGQIVDHLHIHLLSKGA